MKKPKNLTHFDIRYACICSFDSYNTVTLRDCERIWMQSRAQNMIVYRIIFVRLVVSEVVLQDM